MWGALKRTDTGGRETKTEAGVKCLRGCLNKMTEPSQQVSSSEKEIYQKNKIWKPMQFWKSSWLTGDGQLSGSLWVSPWRHMISCLFFSQHSWVLCRPAFSVRLSLHHSLREVWVAMVLTLTGVNPLDLTTPEPTIICCNLYMNHGMKTSCTFGWQSRLQIDITVTVNTMI